MSDPRYIVLRPGSPEDLRVMLSQVEDRYAVAAVVEWLNCVIMERVVESEQEEETQEQGMVVLTCEHNAYCAHQETVPPLNGEEKETVLCTRIFRPDEPLCPRALQKLVK